MGLEHEIMSAEVQRSEMQPRTVVVGFDGSDLARAALELARGRAGASGRVIALYAAELTPVPVMGVPVAAPPAAEPVEEIGRRILDGVRSDGGPQIMREVRLGPPARQLVEVAREASADEIVVGSHGAGRLRALLGSTSHALLHEADRPVVVVTERAAQRLRGPGEPASLIVLGYDGSDDARAALAYARRHLAPGGRILALHAYHAPSEWRGMPYYDSALARRLEYGGRLLGEIEDPPQVVTELMPGAPATVIADVAASRDADEIVVGSSGHGTLRAVLGSVAHALLHEAERPIVIVPKPPRD